MNPHDNVVELKPQSAKTARLDVFEMDDGRRLVVLSHGDEIIKAKIRPPED